MPVPWMDWHAAPVGHWPAAPGLQMSAQLEGVLDGGFSRTHCGWAEAPVGAPGHGADAEHDGEQNDPVKPVMEMADSPVWQVPDAPGSS